MIGPDWWPGRRRIVAMAGVALWIVAPMPAIADPQHAIAMHGKPALGPDFAHLPYVQPDAPKGGRVTLGSKGAFDSVNPFIIKGVSVGNVRGWVVESLLARSADEPFTLYGLIAERMTVPDDRSEITFHLNEAARFSDGKPITSADVVFSYELLKRQGPPYMRSHYGKVANVEAPDAKTVRFVFNDGADREIPLILGLMPILPKHATDADAFAKTTLKPMIGSGPYVIDKVDAPQSITFKRNPDYWARDLPIRRGLFNVDEIKIDYYRDATTLFEAFKTGAVDVRFENDPVRWAEGYDFRAARDGKVVRETAATGLPAGMNALVFNTRKPLFKDQSVRRALNLLFDFQWINKSLYNGQFARTESFFARSKLSANATAASEQERAWLAAHAARVKPAVMEGAAKQPVGAGTGQDRKRFRDAIALFKDAGWTIKSGKLVNADSGAPFRFEFLARSKEQERLMLSFKGTLQRLGIGVDIRQVDNSQYWTRLKTFDFDMIMWRWSASLSPGNEQIARWTSKYADVDGSLNFAGVKNEGVDALVGKMLAARDRDEFRDAVRAFDRLLISGDYVIPLFHAPGIWLAHWSRIKKPDRAPLSGTDINTWWVDDARTAK